MTKALVIMESVHYDVTGQTEEEQEFSSQCAGEIIDGGGEITDDAGEITDDAGEIVQSDKPLCVDCDAADVESGEIYKQRLLIGKDYVKISRPGMGDAFMHFVSGQVTEYVSRTIYGDIFMNIETLELLINRKDTETVAHIHYRLSAAGEVFTECRMKLQVKCI